MALTIRCFSTGKVLLTAPEHVTSWRRFDFSGQQLPQADLRGLELEDANFSEANLRGARLSGAKLRGANLTLADLRDAYLGEADLTRAQLVAANLAYVSLRGATLTGVRFTGANLRGAMLCGQDLRATSGLETAYLPGAYLDRANLAGLNLRAANLHLTYLAGAELTGTQLPGFQIPQEGELIVWKKLKCHVVAKLRIPAEAARTANLSNRKCRAAYADVLELQHASPEFTQASLLEGSSAHNPFFRYRPGERVTPSGYDPDIREACKPGIHFFLTREEAVDYRV